MYEAFNWHWNNFFQKCLLFEKFISLSLSICLSFSLSLKILKTCLNQQGFMCFFFFLKSISNHPTPNSSGLMLSFWCFPISYSCPHNWFISIYITFIKRLTDSFTMYLISANSINEKGVSTNCTSTCICTRLRGHVPLHVKWNDIRVSQLCFKEATKMVANLGYDYTIEIMIPLK